MFKNIYKEKTVLVTGHTGFKGTWLTCWLINLGAKVIGVSKDIPTTPSMFEELSLESKITHYVEDIRNNDNIKKIFNDEKPDFVFHLAAQAIVSLSYEDPHNTLTTNVIGTSNILNAIKDFDHDCIAIFITSDKCYENVEWCWGYKETNHMGGKDIYSASKGAAELVFHAYQQSFFNEDSNIRIATARAGNVIGGGDWAKDRIVADCVRAWSKKDHVEIRSPEATRPWQHVLEPLSGYLNLGMAIKEKKIKQGESFNFGPRAEQNHTVLQLLKDLSKHWDFKSENEVFQVTDNKPFHEAGLLKLNCDKALFHMRWQANLNYDQTVRFVSQWYYKYYKEESVNIFDFTMEQIKEFESLALEQELQWT